MVGVIPIPRNTGVSIKHVHTKKHSFFCNSIVLLLRICSPLGRSYHFYPDYFQRFDPTNDLILFAKRKEEYVVGLNVSIDENKLLK